jgi:hypothetical protein
MTEPETVLWPEHTEKMYKISYKLPLPAGYKSGDLLLADHGWMAVPESEIMSRLESFTGLGCEPEVSELDPDENYYSKPGTIRRFPGAGIDIVKKGAFMSTEKERSRYAAVPGTHRTPEDAEKADRKKKKKNLDS